ncbi:hypothetical protein [Bosea sp. (in: a-proteobacteria)]|jgi:hypothetical protein|uniref:hypothetical protein n=1 Tax=Bosea sp. (in: a-proteobacteria) TaxID=1871050 RepID=UPI003F7003E0
MTPVSFSTMAAALGRGLLLVARGALALLILLDEAARPIYRPAARWLAERKLVERAEAAIAQLPRYAILALLAVPFAIAEPLKLVGLILIGRGQAVLGLVILAFAYLASFLIVERIYHAGRARLLTIGWFAWGMAIIVDLRTRLLSWVRASSLYAAALRTRDAVRAWWRTTRHGRRG